MTKQQSLKVKWKKEEAYAIFHYAQNNVNSSKHCIHLYRYILKYILISQNDPIQPDSHRKHVPLCMWHVFNLQFGGHWISQLLPYTSDLVHPNWNKNRNQRGRFYVYLREISSSMKWILERKYYQLLSMN